MPFNIDVAKIRAEVETESAKSFSKARQNLLYLCTRYESQFEQINPFVGFILDRMDCVSMLINLGKKHDAKIIWRSVLEAFSKFLKITNPPNEPQLRENKLREFWIDTDDIDRMKDSNWAKKVLATNRNKSPEIYEAYILTEEEEKLLKDKPTYSNRAYRKALSESWSFNNILTRLIDEGKTFAIIPLTHIQHTYMIISHYVHADAWAMKQIALSKKHSSELEAVDMLVQFIGDYKAKTEMLMFMVWELSWIVDEKTLFNETVSDYHRFNPYATNQAGIAMAELFRLQDEMFN